MPISKSHTFPKAEKLKSLKQIDLLFREGKSFFAAPVKCYYLVGSRETGVGRPETGVGSRESGVGSWESGVGSWETEVGRPESGDEKSESPEVRTTGGLEDWDKKLEQKLAEGNKVELPKELHNDSNEIQTPNSKLQTDSPPAWELEWAPQTINIKAGVSVSKRNFKHAVDRNRIKRLLREAYRLHKHTLIEKLAEKQVSLQVFFVFTDRTLPTFSLVEDKMKYCIRRLGKIVEGGS